MIRNPSGSPSAGAVELTAARISENSKDKVYGAQACSRTCWILQEEVYGEEYPAELYDGIETHDRDLQLMRTLIGDSSCLRILEPFSGTGRILIPLATDSHRVTGIEIAGSMIERAQRKVRQLGSQIGGRLTLVQGDALLADWGVGFDLIILGSNCFYELSSAEQQERCIKKASGAVRTGGHVFVDNDNYEGDWGIGPFPQERIVIEGISANGTHGRLVLVSIRFDESAHVLHMKRIWSKQTPDGHEESEEYLCRKRPVAGTEVREWLEANGFHIVRMFGSWFGEPFSDKSNRAIFWAQKT